MPQVTVDQAMQAAVRHHQAGRLQQAEQLYRQILARQPEHAPAMHNLGLIAHQVGRIDVAIDLIRRVIALRPNDAEARSNLGIALKSKGQLDEAIAAYRQALALRPNYAEAHYNLGNALKDMGQVDEAIAAYRQAISLRPNYAEAHNNLGNSLKGEGHFSEAIAAYLQASASRTNYAEAYSNLGVALSETGRLDEAVTACRQAIAFRPGYAEAYNSLGNALKLKGQLDEAVAAYRQAIAIGPGFAEACRNLGLVLKEQGQLDEAISAYRQAIALRPNYPEAQYNLGIGLGDKGQADEAIAAYRQAIALRPNYAEAHGNLGIALKGNGLLDDAVTAFRQVIALRPRLPEAHSNLGNALRDLGMLDEAIAAYRQAVVLGPTAGELHSNAVYAVCFHADYGPREILHEARAWAQQHADPLSVPIANHGNDRSIDRPLRIGYVSPNFCEHVVGCNILPVLENHDRSQFHLHCFSSVRTPDSLTQRFQRTADCWHDVAGMNDADLADLVRRQQIDILVDLSLHMGGNRLLTFARKPAPVQVTWAGYPGTTGLNAIDYRLTDPYLDPPGKGDEFYSEKLIRLPHSFWCFRPSSATPDVNSLPALSNGFVTFGCLNDFCKVTTPALDLWARTLRSVADASLLLRCPPGSSRQRVLERFRAVGIDAGRIRFVNRVPLEEYLRLYHAIDIALDPLPYTGHSTSLDAFWMGVPVVTLAGTTVVSRGGVSIASNLEMPNLVARTVEQYVGIAETLAGNLEGLAELRSTMRQRMRGSTLMDEKRFTLGIEETYREMWRGWCSTTP